MRALHVFKEVMRPTLFDFADGGPTFLTRANAHHARCNAGSRSG